MFEKVAQIPHLGHGESVLMREAFDWLMFFPGIR